MSQVEGIILGNNSCDQLSSKDETGVRQSDLLPHSFKGTFSRISDNFFTFWRDGAESGKK